ncbi:MAG: DNA primase [Oscillospiraceae bacterium]
MIPESFIERLKDASDIEQTISSYVPLKRYGRLLKGLCPFHSEKTPSFTVYTDGQQHFYCFGCQKGGDVITFIREMENLEYVEAVRLLAQRAGLPMPEDVADDGASRLKARILELNRTAARFFHQCLIDERGKDARVYLAGRGLSRKTVRNFGLGYAPDSWNALTDHLISKGFTQEEMLAAAVASKGRRGLYDQFRGRVIFPILDLRGNVVGFGGRAMSDRGPKYLNSGDTPVFKKSRHLYALNFAKGSGSDKLLLAEGYMDVISLHQAGFTNAVATLGTALTADQARLISQYTKNVAIAYDSDGAGQNAARRAINLFSQLEVQVSVLDIQGAKDPDDYIKTYGAHRFQNLIDSGKSALSFEIDKLKSARDMETPEGKTAFLNDFCRLMANISSDIQRDVYLSEIARELEVDKERLKTTTEAIRKKRAGSAKRRQVHNLKPFVQDNPAGKSLAVKPEELGAAVAERSLIAMLMQNPDYYDDIRSKLSDEDFVSPDHAAIFRAVCAQLEQQRIPDPIYLSAYLSTAQMGMLSLMMATGKEVTYKREQLDEFIQAIKQKPASPEEIAQLSPQEAYKRALENRKRRSAL